MTSRTLRLALGVVAVAACSVASPAHAASGAAPAPLSPAELKAAAAAATSADGQRLAGQLAEATGGESLSAADRTLRPATAPLQVNNLSPEFVATGQGPVASAAYVASTGTVDGHAVTLWSMKTDSGWKAVNAADGDVEARMAAAADGAPMFKEPQINAWFALKGDTVVGLNDAAKQAVGKGMSITDYQKMVHTRYGDKLPGSAYARSSKGGGFTPQTGKVVGQTPEPLAGSPLAAAGIGAIALVGVGGAFVRRRATSR